MYEYGRPQGDNPWVLSIV